MSVFRLGEKPYPTQILQRKLYELLLQGKRIDGRGSSSTGRSKLS